MNSEEQADPGEPAPPPADAEIPPPPPYQPDLSLITDLEKGLEPDDAEQR